MSHVRLTLAPDPQLGGSDALVHVDEIRRVDRYEGLYGFKCNSTIHLADGSRVACYQNVNEVEARIMAARTPPRTTVYVDHPEAP